MKRVVVVFLLTFVFSNLVFSQKKNIPPERPKLVVGIVIDQMRMDYLYRFWDKYEKNGFKRLVNEGAVFRNAHLNYLFTHTSCGHATIYTGAVPSVHGIVSNTWYVRSRKQKIYCVDDSKAQPVGTVSSAGMMGPSNLLTTTIGDELRLATMQKGKVIGISLKDRAAILSAGHSANAAYWYDGTTGNWITSTHYMDKLPRWVEDFNKKKLPDMYLDRLWTTLLPIDKYTESLPDASPYEYGFGDNQTVFPYDLSFLSKRSRKEKDYNFLKNTPYGNTLTNDFAIAAILSEDLGKDDIPDLLAISYSSTDYLGHRYSPYSLEIQDMYLRIDREIAHLIDFLDKEIGKENVLVFLTSDHGASQHPEHMKSLKIPAGMFNPAYAMALLKTYLNAVYGQGDWIQEYLEGQIYLNHNLIEDSKLSIREVQERTAAFMIQFNGVANAITAYSMAYTPFSEGLFKMMQNSYNQERSGDVFINLRPGWVEDSVYPVHHNSAYPYDTHVPLIFYGWKIPRQTVYKKTYITDIAPTLSIFLNIAMPNGAMGDVLTTLFN